MRLLHLIFAACGYACASIISTAAAASFDCNKAASAVERAICAEPALSALDDRLAALYQDLLATTKDRAALVRLQHEWLAPDSDLEGNRSICEERADTRSSCLSEVYEKRLDLLAAFKPLLQQPDQPAGAGLRFDLRQVSAKYDFTIRLLKTCEAEMAGDSFNCEQAGVVYISKKGQTTPIQVIPMNNIFLSLYRAPPSLTEKKIENTRARTAEYGEQSTILVGDFNFDGEEDIAIRNGNRSSYNGPSFDVFLQSRAQGRFLYNAALTRLVQNTLGFFQTDTKRKRLKTAEKSGCCYHVATEYLLINDQPVPVVRTIHDGLVEGKYNYVYDERWVNGRWQRIKSRRADRQQ